MRREADSILVKRLQGVYWPSWCERITYRRVMRARPLEHSNKRGDSYDPGRVRYFVERFKRGESVDPIRIDTDVIQYSYGSPPVWGLPIIDDGHHRFVAAVLLRKRRIRAHIAGLVAYGEWLKGERRQLPEIS